MQGGPGYWFPQLIAVLPFNCSCLVSSSPIEVWQFKFKIFPQVWEISSVVHFLSCFGGGFLLCLFTGISMLGTYFFAPSPFPCGRVSVLSVLPCSQCVMMVHCLFFNFAGQFDFGCCSLAQEMSSVIHYLPCFREWPITCQVLAFLPFWHLFTDSLCLDLLLSPPCFSAALSAFLLPLLLY
jgi:hypothetical protein